MEQISGCHSDVFSRAKLCRLVKAMGSDVYSYSDRVCAFSIIFVDRVAKYRFELMCIDQGISWERIL